MTKEQSYNIICDIAEDAGVTPDELLAALQSQSNERFAKTVEGLDEESARYVTQARNERLQLRESKRKAESEKSLDGDVRQFRELFPDVSAESIPDTVWADMERGIPLAYAYAYYVLNGNHDTAYAEQVNGKNSEGAIPPVADGETDGDISMAEVEAMSPAAVKKNFPDILRSIAKWRI